MGRAFSSSAAFADHETGIDIWVEYQDNNRRVRTLNWSVPAGVWARAWIWDNGALILDHSIAGPGVGSTNVAGSYTMREITDEGGTWLDFPAGIEYMVQVSNQQF